MNKLFIAIAIVAVIVGGALWYSYEPTPEPEPITVGIQMGDMFDVIGSRVGTTTTAVAFYSAAYKATTTYPFVIESYVDTATFYLKATEASSTAAVFTRILASNDPQCDTATTTTTMANTYLVSEIEWFDVGTNIREFAGSTTIPAATSTQVWNPVEAQARTLTLTDLNARCLALQVSGIDVVLYVGVVTKSSKEY